MWQSEQDAWIYAKKVRRKGQQEFLPFFGTTSMAINWKMPLIQASTEHVSNFDSTPRVWAIIASLVGADAVVATELAHQAVPLTGSEKCLLLHP